MSPLGSAPASPTDQPTASFLERIIGFLLPLFLDTTGDLIAARIDVLETLSGYPISGNADLLAAAQVIAFGLSALDNLGHAMAPELSTAQRVRYRAGANALNRSAQQNRARLEHRHPASPEGASPEEPSAHAVVPTVSSTTAREITDDDIREALVQARRMAAPAHSAFPPQPDADRLGGSARRTGPQTEPTGPRPPHPGATPFAGVERQRQTNRLWASAMTQVAQQLTEGDEPSPDPSTPAWPSVDKQTTR